MKYVNQARGILLEKLKKYRYPALILALGLGLLLIPAGGRQETPPAQEMPAQQGDFDLTSFTKDAETLLSGIRGAGTVRLLLTMDTDGRREYLTEGSSSGAAQDSQTETRAVRLAGDTGEEAVTVERSYPAFRGAVALCPGGGDPAVALQIKQALSSLTGLGMDKIAVFQSA